MAVIYTNMKILILVLFYLTLVSSAPHGLNDQSSIALTTTSALKTALTTVFALGTIVSLAIVFFGCICCQQQRFKSVGSQQNGIPLPQQNSTNLERGNDSEFAIFPPPHAVLKPPINLNQHDEAVTFEPLPDIRLRKFSSPVASGYFPKPAYFSSDVNKGLSLHDWFDDPQANFPRNQLQYFSEVGSGWFGQVVEGEAQQIIPEEKKTQVVVKILREDASPSEHIYFLHEVRLFRDLKHPNIIRLLGRCLEVDPFLVILEHGHVDLKTYLIQHRSNPESLLQNGQALRAACHVAKGLNHMHENNFIHTDLAARNCIVSHDRTVKIGDYGITVNAFKEDYYCVGGIALPIRWCAPESLVYSDNAIRTKELTQEANIWSFGVLLWEMIELGKLPYMEYSDDEVLQKTIVDQVLTLERPKTPCVHKDQLWQVMQLCWNLPQDRPSIQKVSSLLEHLFENKDVASDSIAFETRWNALQPVIREHNINPKSVHDTRGIALTFESDFVPNNQHIKMTRNDDLLSSNFNVSSLRETSSSRCSLTHSFEANFGATISPSLQNLRGSLDDLSLHNSLERERKWDPLNVTNNPTNYNNKLNESKTMAQEQLDDKVINDQICEAIKDLDEFLAGEVTSSEVSKDTTPERNDSGDEDESELKKDIANAKFGKTEQKNGSATTLTDVNTDTGDTLPKDSSDDSLHAHLHSDFDKQDENNLTPVASIKLPLIESQSDRFNDKLQTEPSVGIKEDFKLEKRLRDENEIAMSEVGSFPEKESQRDSAIVLESENSSSTSSRIDDMCLTNSPLNIVSSQTRSVNDMENLKGESSVEEYVSTNASLPAFLPSLASDTSALSILNESLTCGKPGSTASMAIGVKGGYLLLASANETNSLSSQVESLPSLTNPVNNSQSEEPRLMQLDCDFRSTLKNNDANDTYTFSTNNHPSLNLNATNSQNVKSNQLSDSNILQDVSDYSDEDNDVVEGCTDDIEVNIFSDSDLESLGEGYESLSNAGKTSTPNKDTSKPSVSLSESSLGATYHTACDESNIDTALKLEETSVLPFIEITLCEDMDTDTMFDTCHSETPTLNDEQNTDSYNGVSETFEEQLGFLGQDGEGVENNCVEAVNSEMLYRLTQSTPSDQSPSMLSLPSCENLKLDKDCFSEALFMQTDEGNCRPNYKSQLASFAFQKELNGIALNRDLAFNYEKPEIDNLSKSPNRMIFNNVFEQSNGDVSSDSFIYNRHRTGSYDDSYINGDFDQSNPELHSNSFIFVNSNHSNSWFQPPPEYEESRRSPSYYDEEESIVEDISDEMGAQAAKFFRTVPYSNRPQEYQLEDILACLEDSHGGNDNPAYSEDDVETNPSIFSPVEDSGKYSSMADEDDNSIILDDLNQGAHCSDDMKDYLDDEVLIVDTETNEAVMLDSKERLSLAMEEENMAYFERQLYVNEVYDPDNYYGPTKLESIVEEFEGMSNATSPAYSGNSNLSDDASPDKSGLQLKINNFGFNSQEELDKSISDACSCPLPSEDEECSTNFGARSIDSLECSPRVKRSAPVLIFEGEEYLAGAETDDGFDDYEAGEYEDTDKDRPGTSMLMAQQFQDYHSQSASETDEEDFIQPQEKRGDDVYTPDFDSDTDDTSSTGTSESSTSGSFECSNDALDEEDENVKASTPLQSPKKLSPDDTPTSPVKIFSTAWDCTITPTKSAIKSPEKKQVGDMKKSVSFHEEGPAYIFSYPPESDSEEDEGNEEAPEFSWHVDYSSYADWEFQALDDEEIPEDIVEIDDIEIPEKTPPTPVNLSTMMYTITGISDDDLLDSLDSQNQYSMGNGIPSNFGYPEMSEIKSKEDAELDERRIWLNYAIETETTDNFEEKENPWPIDDFPEILTSADEEDVDNILETINPFMIDVPVKLPHVNEPNLNETSSPTERSTNEEIQNSPLENSTSFDLTETKLENFVPEIKNNIHTPHTSNLANESQITKSNTNDFKMENPENSKDTSNTKASMLPDICKDLFDNARPVVADYNIEENIPDAFSATLKSASEKSLVMQNDLLQNLQCAAQKFDNPETSDEVVQNDLLQSLQCAAQKFDNPEISDEVVQNDLLQSLQCAAQKFDSPETSDEVVQNDFSQNLQCASQKSDNSETSDEVVQNDLLQNLQCAAQKSDNSETSDEVVKNDLLQNLHCAAQKFDNPETSDEVVQNDLLQNLQCAAQKFDNPETSDEVVQNDLLQNLQCAAQKFDNPETSDEVVQNDLLQNLQFAAQKSDNSKTSDEIVQNVQCTAQKFDNSETSDEFNTMQEPHPKQESISTVKFDLLENNELLLENSETKFEIPDAKINSIEGVEPSKLTGNNSLIANMDQRIEDVNQPSDIKKPFDDFDSTMTNLEETERGSLCKLDERAFNMPQMQLENIMHYNISPNNRVYRDMQMNYNLNDRKDAVQDIPLEIDEILFEMERNFSLSDMAIASPEPIIEEDAKMHSLIKFKEESLSFEGESSESKSSSSLARLNDSSPALSSDIDIGESDMEDNHDESHHGEKYVIKNRVMNTDNLVNSTILNGNFISDNGDLFNYENNNDGRARFLNEVVNKELVNKFKMDNSPNQETISS